MFLPLFFSSVFFFCLLFLNIAFNVWCVKWVCAGFVLVSWGNYGFLYFLKGLVVLNFWCCSSLNSLFDSQCCSYPLLVIIIFSWLCSQWWKNQAPNYVFLSIPMDQRLSHAMIFLYLFSLLGHVTTLKLIVILNIFIQFFL